MSTNDIQKALAEHAAQERKRALFRCVLWVVFLPAGVFLLLFVIGLINEYAP